MMIVDQTMAYLIDDKEVLMQLKTRKSFETIIDREKLMQLRTCAACNRPFNLGDPVVMACGAWEGPAQFIHANEAVFDSDSRTYIERKCYSAKSGRI